MQKARWGNDQQVRNRRCSQRLIGSPGHNMQITGNSFMWEGKRKWESEKRRRKIGEIWQEIARPWHPQRVKSHILIVNNSNCNKSKKEKSIWSLKQLSHLKTTNKCFLPLKWNWVFSYPAWGKGCALNGTLKYCCFGAFHELRWHNAASHPLTPDTRTQAVAN